MMVLEACNLSKRYQAKVPILEGVDLSVKAGESLAITGRSGEGKSTLLHILGTLEKPCSGKVWIAGQETHALNRAHLRNAFLGFVFQSFYLLEDCTCLDNVLMPAKIARKPVSKKSKATLEAARLIERVGLKEHALAKNLSGGEKQRLAIARALCNGPRILFADEPTGNLDLDTAKTVQDLLFSLVHENEMALILVTHDLELARLCDRLCLLERGKLIEKGFAFA